MCAIEPYMPKETGHKRPHSVIPFIELSRIGKLLKAEGKLVVARG